MAAVYFSYNAGFVPFFGAGLGAGTVYILAVLGYVHPGHLGLFS